MAKLSMAERRALPKSDFAVPSKAPGPGSYPMNDPQHRAAAAGFAAMHHDAGAERAVHAKLKRHGGYGGKVFDDGK